MTNPTQASTLQMFPWTASLAAVKHSASFADFETFYADLADSLPQNSPATRRRMANLIVRRYFPERSIYSLPTLVWRAYQREDILVDILRVMTLEAEPVVAQFVVQHVLALAPGDQIEAAVARDFITAVFGGFNHKSYERLFPTLQALGLIKRQGQQRLIQALPNPDDAFLILLHARLAPTPRIVRLSDILAANWPRFLGLRAPEQIRALLHDAQAAGLIARYVSVDELEQVTTRFSFADYLAGALHL